MKGLKEWVRFEADKPETHPKEGKPCFIVSAKYKPSDFTIACFLSGNWELYHKNHTIYWQYVIFPAHPENLCLLCGGSGLVDCLAPIGKEENCRNCNGLGYLETLP